MLMAFETGLPVIGDWAVFNKSTNEQVTETMTYGKAINELADRGHENFELRRVN